MAKLVVLCGVPGSGKSYFSRSLREEKKGHVYIISSDQLRDLITGNQQNFEADKIMWQMYYQLAKVYATDPNGIVVLDATNISTDLRISKTEELKPYFSEIDLVIFNLPKEIVQEQNLNRDFPVPENVLENFMDSIQMVTEEDKKYFTHIYLIKDHNIESVLKAI